MDSSTDCDADFDPTIAGFCKRHRIVKSTYHKMDNKGLGPRKVVVGKVVRITPQADRDWIAAREQPTDTEQRLLQLEREARSHAASKAGKIAVSKPNHRCRRKHQRTEGAAG